MRKLTYNFYKKDIDRQMIEELEHRIENLEKENKTIYEENITLRNIEWERDNLQLELTRVKNSFEESSQELSKQIKRIEQLKHEVSQIGSQKAIL